MNKYHHEIIKYNPVEYDFISLISGLFNNCHLNELHKETEEKYDVFEVSRDSISVFHKTFYDKLRSGWPEFEYLYKRFIKEIISPLYSENFIYQTTPTFRVALPFNLAVGAFHTDSEFGHPKESVNYILPLSYAQGTGTLWCESEPGKNDFEPIIMIPGQLIKFNGSTLRHGNKINKTTFTRVSMDFRCLKLCDYKENEVKSSITTNTKFKIGAYYNLFKK